MHFLSPSSILFSWHLSYQFVGCSFVILCCSMLLLVYFSNESIVKRKRTAHRGAQKSVQPNLLLVLKNSGLLFAIMQYLFGYCFAAQKLLYTPFRKSYLMLLPI